MSKLIDVVLCYDFDGTLASGNMQEPGFMKKLGISPKSFWEKSDKMAADYKADSKLCYMRCLLAVAKSRKIKLRHARVIPQVGQGIPVISYSGHLKIPRRMIAPKIKIQVLFLFIS